MNTPNVEDLLQQIQRLEEANEAQAYAMEQLNGEALQVQLQLAAVRAELENIKGKR
jgi:hypothetical protein